MSGRKLVYADDIYRYIKTEINPYGKPFHGSAYELGLKIMEHIERMQAAYDVDKVVEQLEKECDWDEHVDLHDAIKIVKEGGINEVRH